MMLSMVQFAGQPAAARNRRSTVMPCCVCMTSGWNWVPNRRRLASSAAATGVAAVLAVTVKPGGATAQVSPCDIHTRWLTGVPPSRTPPGSPAGPAADTRSSPVAPYSPPPVRRTSPPSPDTMSWKP